MGNSLCLGIIWVISYQFIYSHTKPTAKRGLILGGASGLIGIIVWDSVLQLHPKPPVWPKRQRGTHATFYVDPNKGI